MNMSPETFTPLLGTAPVLPSPRRTAEPTVAFPAPARRRLDAVPTQFHPLVDPAATERGGAEVREHARAAGFAAGFAAGAREAARQAEVEAERARAAAADRAAADAAEQARLTAALTAAARSLTVRQAPVLAQAEARLHAAALELAQAVLGVELSDGPTSARAALARVLSAEPAGEVTVRLHPRDVAALGTAPDGVRVVADPTLAPGDAVAEHADGALDARIGAALDRARAVLAEEAAGAGQGL
jgi:flagellar assembly protein FliH